MKPAAPRAGGGQKKGLSRGIGIVIIIIVAVVVIAVAALATRKGGLGGQKTLAGSMQDRAKAAGYNSPKEMFQKGGGPARKAGETGKGETE